MKGVAESVGLSDPVVVQGMYIFKQPRIGTEGEVPKVFQISGSSARPPCHYRNLATYLYYGPFRARPCPHRMWMTYVNGLIENTKLTVLMNIHGFLLMKDVIEYAFQ